LGAHRCEPALDHLAGNLDAQAGSIRWLIPYLPPLAPRWTISSAFSMLSGIDGLIFSEIRTDQSTDKIQQRKNRAKERRMLVWKEMLDRSAP
jgi:hypothetical protein